MIKNNLNLIYSLLFTICIIITYHFLQNVKNEYVIIDNTRIYDGFKMKIHYQQEIENKMLIDKNRLDSMRIELKMLLMKSQHAPHNKMLAKEVESKNNELNVFQIAAKERAEQLAEKYENQIWSQINQYIKEYGQENNFKVIFGAIGDGSVMYADESTDYTEKVLNFINSKYESVE